METGVIICPRWRYYRLTRVRSTKQNLSKIVANFLEFAIFYKSFLGFSKFEFCPLVEINNCKLIRLSCIQTV